MPVFSPPKSSPKDTWNSFLAHRTWLWLAGVELLIMAGTWLLPLARELHYEFAAVMALSFSITTGFTVVAAGNPRPIFGRSGGGGHEGPVDEAPRVWDLVATVIAISLIPLAVEIVHALLGMECGAADGTAWYLLLVPPSAVISLVIALLCRVATDRRWLRILLFLLLWSGSLLRGAYEAYTGPHIFLYSWQVGFFPGGSWDPDMPITLRLLLYRALHLAVAGGLAAVVLELRRTSRPERPPFAAHASLGLTALTICVAMALIPQRVELGLSRTDRWLRHELGDSVVTAHATIYYDRARTDSAALWSAANRTDFYVERHARRLGLPLERVQPVSFYLYPGSDVQKEYVGTSSASFTKPWKRTLNIARDRVDGTLEHELAHIVIEPFGGPLGISWSQGLLEGAAVALTGDEGWMSLHEYAESAYEGLRPPSADRLMGTGGFTSVNSSLAYMLAGSFSRWLIETRGMPRYLRVYRSSDFQKVYGVPLSRLAADYRAFLATQRPERPIEGSTLRYFYGGGSFFEQRCLRRLGTLNRRGFELLADERYADALRAFRESMEEGITTSARIGVLRSLAGLGRYDRLLDSARVYLADSLWEPFLPSLIEIGDAEWALGRPVRAAASYERILRYGVGATLDSRAALRRYFISSSSPELRGLMRTYFTRPLQSLQRLELLHRARRHATGRELAILELMSASWTAASYPRFTAQGISPELRSLMAGPPAAPADARQTLELFILESLRRTISEPLLIDDVYRRGQGTQASGELLRLAPFPSNELRRAVALHIPWMPLPTLRSQNEERTERLAFLEFTRRHPVLP